MLPNVICIGTFKAGTTWLHTMLSQHPDIFVPQEKGLMFFSKYYARGIVWYQQFFAGTGDKKIRAEICPAYFTHPDAIERIYRHLPAIKGMAILRNPVEQVYSMYCMEARRGMYEKSFEAFVSDKDVRALNNALYATHIKRFLSHFEKSQLLILLYDDLVKDPKGFLKTIYDFLDIPEYYPEDVTHRVNKGGVPRHLLLDKTIARSGKFLREHNLYGLKMLLNRTGISNRLKRFNLKQEAPEPIEPSLREYLNRFYAQDKQELEVMLGKDLSFWR